MMNTIEITGNLGADPELRVTDNGPVASFSLANTPRLRDGSQGNTTWVTVQVWDDLANIVAESLKKGSFVSVSGRLVQQSWVDKDSGTKRTRHVIRGTSVWKPLTERRKSESVPVELPFD
jgi:single-strand DNA-binding protein